MSMTADQLRHEALLQRIATGVLKTQLYPSLDAAYKAVKAILYEQEQIRSPAQLNRITKAVSAAILELYEPALEQMNKEFTELAVYEADYYANLIGKWNDVELAVPASKTIADYVSAALLSLDNGSSVTAGLWSEIVNKSKLEYIEQYNSIIKTGYVKSATVQQIAKSLQLFNDWLARQHAETLARTGVMHYANSARRSMADDNANVIDTEYPLVMFDNRRSQICTGIYVKYSKGWPLNQSPIGYPPYHRRCRTSIIYGVKGMGPPRGFMPTIGAGKDYPEDAEKKPVYKGKKDVGKFKIEQVKYGTDLDVWMKDQGFAFVADNLGVERAKLLFDGKLSLAQMSDVYGRPLSIAELKERDRDAFVKAGLIKE